VYKAVKQKPNQRNFIYSVAIEEKWVKGDPLALRNLSVFSSIYVLVLKFPISRLIR
jgi:hypothetical protein